MRKYRHARRLSLLALACLHNDRDCRPVFVGLVARRRYGVLAAGLKRAREHAGGGARLAGEAAAALALALRVFIASVLDALRSGRTAPVVRRPHPVRTFERFALPLIEVVQPDTPAPSTEHQQAKDLFVGTPRKDGRRPGRVRFTYRPFTGQRLKRGEYLAAKEGRRYRRVEGGGAAAA